MNWAVIMAGGSGTRFWPLSRRTRPKQLLALASEKTMLEDTVQRLKKFAPYERMIIVTGKDQRPAMRRLLPEIPADQIIAEPEAKNTAPCLVLAAHFIQAKDKNAVMTVLPADQAIRHEQKFVRALKLGAKLALQENHVVFGIRPDSPHTGYGYIECRKVAKEMNGMEVREVLRFTEKPDQKRALRFLRSGKHFWNSGMFAWNLPFFLKEADEHIPEVSLPIAKAFQKSKKDFPQAIQKAFKQVPSVSIDYGLMEKVKNIKMIQSPFSWSDLGSWPELSKWKKKDRNKNVFIGDVLPIDSRENIVWTDQRMVALLGVENIIVVVTKDAVLVADKSKAQDIRKIVSELGETRKDLL